MPTQFYVPLNNVAASLGAAHASGSGTLVLAAGQGAQFGSTFPVRVTVVKASSLDAQGRITDTAGVTIFAATGRTDDTLTVSGAIEGTADQTFAEADSVFVAPTAGAVADLNAAVNALEPLRSPSGNLLLTAGSLPVSPADGEVAYGTTQGEIAAYAGGIWGRLPRVLFTQTAAVTVTGTANTSLIGAGVGTVTLPANFLKAGKVVRVTAGGIYTSLASGPGSLRFRVLLGGTAALDMGTSKQLTAAQTDRAWSLDAMLTCVSAGASGSVTGWAMNVRGGSTAVVDIPSAVPVTVDTTTSLALDVDVLFGATGNSITVNSLVVLALN